MGQYNYLLNNFNIIPPSYAVAGSAKYSQQCSA